jgi:hypothetical protein
MYNFLAHEFTLPYIHNYTARLHTNLKKEISDNSVEVASKRLGLTNLTVKNF